jgi:hypothetical protein
MALAGWCNTGGKEGWSTGFGFIFTSSYLWFVAELDGFFQVFLEVLKV